MSTSALIRPRYGVERRQVRDDEIDAEQLGLGKHDAGIDEDSGIPAGDEQHVHAELAESAERDDVDGRRCRAAPVVIIDSDLDSSRTRAPSRRVATLASTAAARARRRFGSTVSGLMGRWEDPKNRRENCAKL